MHQLATAKFWRQLNAIPLLTCRGIKPGKATPKRALSTGETMPQSSRDSPSPAMLYAGDEAGVRMFYYFIHSGNMTKKGSFSSVQFTVAVLEAVTWPHILRFIITDTSPAGLYKPWFVKSLWPLEVEAEFFCNCYTVSIVWVLVMPPLPLPGEKRQIDNKSEFESSGISNPQEGGILWTLWALFCFCDCWISWTFSPCDLNPCVFWFLRGQVNFFNCFSSWREARVM